MKFYAIESYSYVNLLKLKYQLDEYKVLDFTNYHL